MKFTKVTRPERTKKRLKNSDRPISTGALSTALKSYSLHKTGVEAENAVAEYLKLSGWSLIARRFKTPYAEVDILARDRAGVLFVIEVKKIRDDFHDGIVSSRQLQRLRRASESLEAGLVIAAAGQDGSVNLLDDF